ncbi:MAG: hypothetical protein NC124_20765, partial [Clostridium sp.]|nr:hypothetical protein [Clostridium sp.]
MQKYGCTDKICAWADNNKLKFDQTYMESRLKIIEPEKLPARMGLDCDVIVASSAYDKIREQLMILGYQQDRIHLYNFAFMDIEYTDKEFIVDHLEDFTRSFDR